ncbi:MAG: hypothetical protein L0Y58_04905 [Verrucomicrobia subdivision 3 bacterium]|nr:hypothetical protein [Limisphaerales bacterium]
METWFLLRSPAGSAAYNMALDEALLSCVEKCGASPIFRFYSWSEPAASFGYFQRYAEVAAATPLRPLVRRPTGGGIVPHGRDWTYSLCVPPSHAWYRLKALDSYRQIHQWIRVAFEILGIRARLAPTRRVSAPGQCFAGAEQFDVLFRNCKIAGAAQRRTQDGLLIQGSIQPPAEADRDAWERAICGRAAEEWSVQWAVWQPPSDVERQAAALAANKYSKDHYNQHR